jgi:WD40 repeat protein
MKAVLLSALASVALAGCRHTPTFTPGLVNRLKETPNSYLSGEVEDIHDFQLMNNRDFVYSIAVSPDSDRVAFSHLGMKTFQLGLWTLEGQPKQVADPDVNIHEFDVEALDFSPDGKTVVTASRDGSLRFYAAATGAPLGAYLAEEPLVAVAFHSSGNYVVAGSARGLVTVISFPSLEFAFEQRVHEGEVRAIASTAEGMVYTGGWDKSIVAFDASEAPIPTDSARLHFERRGGYSVVRGNLDGRVAVSFALDERAPYAVITTDAAKIAGIDVPFLKDNATVATPLGNTLVRLAKGRKLRFKALELDDVDVAICDACVPGGAQGVLGAAVTDRLNVAFDQVSEEAVLTAKNPTAPAATRMTLTLKPRKRMTFDWYVNDFSMDRVGRYLGVAFSEMKAERTRAIYEREKKGIPEPMREGDCGAIVDSHTGLIIRKWNRHEGVVSTAGISPDGQTLATGGWDKRLFVNTALEREPVAKREYGWSLRRIRFSQDGRFLLVAAWTPQNPLGDQQSNPSAVVYEVSYKSPDVQGGPTNIAR